MKAKLSFLALLTCLVLCANEAQSATIYFKNNFNWTTVNCYAWTEGGEDTWPGTAMTYAYKTVDGYEIYQITTSEAYCIFNNGTDQTDDLTVTDGMCYSLIKKDFYTNICSGEWGTVPDPAQEKITFTVNGLWYEQTNKDTVEVIASKSGTKYSGNITIPSTVTYDGVKYIVSYIGFQAFMDCTDLTSISIPNSVTSIVSYAFENCSSLTSITIPNSVTEIMNYAFDGCPITSVNIPNSVTYLGSYLFDYNLKSITIGSGIKRIDEKAFYHCSLLTSITIYAQEPPTAYTNCFDNYNVFLYVPCNCLSAYQTDKVWGSFKYIQCAETALPEIDETEENAAQKICVDGNIYILRNGKYYSLSGTEVQ